MIESVNENQNTKSNDNMIGLLLVLGAVILYVANQNVQSMAVPWFPFIADELGYDFMEAGKEFGTTYFRLGVFTTLLTVVTGFFADKYKKHGAILAEAVLLAAIGALVYQQANSLQALKIGLIILGCGSALANLVLWFLIFNYLPFQFARATTVAAVLAIDGFVSTLSPYFFTIGSIQIYNVGEQPPPILQARYGIGLIVFFTIGILGLTLIALTIRTKRQSHETVESSPENEWRKNLLALLFFLTGITSINLFLRPDEFEISMRAYGGVVTLVQFLSPAAIIVGGVLADLVHWGVKKYFNSNAGYLFYLLPMVALYSIAVPLIKLNNDNFLSFYTLHSLLSDLVRTIPLVLIWAYFPRAQFATWLGVSFAISGISFSIIGLNTGYGVSYVLIVLSAIELMILFWKDNKLRKAPNPLQEEKI